MRGSGYKMRGGINNMDVNKRARCQWTETISDESKAMAIATKSRRHGGES